MYRSGISEKEQNAWIMAASVIPAAAAAAQASWVAVLAALGLCYVLSKGPVNTRYPKWIHVLRGTTLTILLCAFMPDAAACWPGKYAEIAVPTALLVMAATAAIKGEEIAARSANVLRYGALLFLGAVLLVGVREIETQNLSIQWYMPKCALFTALLLPVIGEGEHRGKQIGKLGVVSLAASGIVGGVMGRKADLYEFSKSISLLGASERMESLMASAMTVGYYALAAFLLTRIGKECAKDNPKRRNMGMIGAVLIAEASLWCEWNGKTCLLPILIIALWTIVPLLATMKRIWKN